MKRLHPSSAAFAQGDIVITEYSSGCLRQILIASHGIRTEIPDTYSEVGARHEELHEAKLISEGAHYEREANIKVPIPGYDELCILSGRIDFKVYNENVGKIIHETKATISKNTRLKVIRKGLVKINQLAQLVAYMIAEETCYGKLVCAYYEYDEDTKKLELQEDRDFKVQIDAEGNILIDGMPSGYTVYDQIAHRTLSAKTITDNVVGDRPDGWHQKYSGPCTYCVFKTTCDKYDNNEIRNTEEFIDSARQDAEYADANKRPDPQPNIVKKRKQKGARK